MHRPPRRYAPIQQGLDGLQDADGARLVVQGPAPPHVSVGDPPPKRRVRPGRGVFDRHHVDVRHEYNRREGRGASPPGIEATQPVDVRRVEGGVDGREGLGHVPIEVSERRRVELRRIPPGNGSDLEGLGKPPGRIGGDRRGHRLRLCLARLDLAGPDRDDGKHSSERQSGADQEIRSWKPVGEHAGMSERRSHSAGVRHDPPGHKSEQDAPALRSLHCGVLSSASRCALGHAAVHGHAPSPSCSARLGVAFPHPRR